MQSLPQLVRVLVVHHEGVVAEIYAKFFRHRGYVVESAENAEQAIEIATRFKPHAAVCDVMLPGTSGVDLDLWFREHQPGCRVLLVCPNPKGFQMVEDSIRRGHSHTVLQPPIQVSEMFDFVAATKSDT